MFEVINLKKTYKNQNGNYVGLKNISFKLGDRGIVFLFGQSGEGKSTLLNIMSGLDTYDAGGRVMFNGKDIMKMSQLERDYYRSREIGIIFEKNNLLDDLTVEENVKIARQIGGHEVTQEQVENALDVVKLKGFAKRRISELSSGEVQRVAIARVLLLNPKVVFLDEPTGSLDNENAKIFWDAIREISKKSLIVAISHRQEVVKEYADRILTIKSGEIISDEYQNKKLKVDDKEVFETAKPKVKKSVEKTGILPFKTNLKIGAKALVANKFKFVAMLVLIALTLVSFATSFLLASFNPNLVKTKTIASGEYKYVVFEKSDKSLVTSQDLANIYEKNDGTQFSIIYSSNDKIPNAAEPNNVEITGFVEVSQNADSNYNTLGQRVLYGTYPAQNTEDVEIAISDYLAKLFIKNGFELTIVDEGEPEHSETCEDWEIKQFASSTSRAVKIEIAGSFYKIAAVYQTDFAKYVDSNLKVIEGKEKEFAYNNENVYSLIHVSNGKVNKLIENEKVVITKLTFTLGNNEMTVNNQKITGISDLDSGTQRYSTKSTLAKSEILLPLDVFNRLFGASLDATFFTESDKDTIFNNATAGTAKWVSILSAGGKTGKYQVIGVTGGSEVVFADNKTDSNGNLVIEGCIGEMVQLNNFPTFKIATKFTNANDFLAVLTNLTSNNFEYLSEYTESINNATDFIAQLRVIFVTVTIFCLVVSVACMITFFADIIRGRKRSIGALRSLGAKSVNIFLIFFLSCLILMVESVVLGGVLSVISDLVINVKLMSAFSIGVTLFHMNGATFGMMLGLGCAVVVVGSLIPISIYCAKAPIDVIKR